MKRQAYNSEPLPITWTKAQYIEGKRDRVYVFHSVTQIDLGQALEWVRSDDPRHKRIPNTNIQDENWIPSEKLLFRVDSAAVMRHHAISLGDTSRLLKEMVIDLSGKNSISKEAITILDMLHTNNWKRPMYFAITVDPNQFVRLDKYMQRTGLTYRITPIIARGGEEEDSRPKKKEKMYDNLMHKFRWGGMDKPGVYIDETVMNMCKSYRGALFGELAMALLEEEKVEKAVAVLDRAMQVLPMENIPSDRSVLILAQAYLAAGEFGKGEHILNNMADFYMQNIRWMFRLRPDLKATIAEELSFNMSLIQYIIRLGMENNPDFGKSFRDEFSNYRMALTRQPGSNQ
jgi:hypothetical protein